MDQPHILFITSDQHRGDTLGCAGHGCVRTPHLDKLAQMGARFDRTYADCPICVPQRTTIITGIQSHIYGMPTQNEAHRIDQARALFLGSLMTRAGYQTQLVGKTHWHTDPSFRAGFENVLSNSRYNAYLREHGPARASEHAGIGLNEINPALSTLPPELYQSNWLIEESIRFLSHRDKTQPFFLWVSVNDPHPPNIIHEPFYSMYDDDQIPEANLPEWAFSDDCPSKLREHRLSWNFPPIGDRELRKARGVYYGKVTNLDHQFARLIGKLQSEKLLENTWLVYTSDHGEALGDFGDVGKMSFLECSTNVPLIIVPPRSFAFEPGRVLDSLVGLDDLLPTFCDIVGIEAPSDVTGHSILPLLSGAKVQVRDAFHGQIDDAHLYHDGRHKYLYFAGDGTELLFDAQDRQDRHNLTGRKDLLQDIRARFIRHLTAEGHEHVRGGELVNLQKQPRTEARLKASYQRGWRP